MQVQALGTGETYTALGKISQGLSSDGGSDGGEDGEGLHLD